MYDPLPPKIGILDENWIDKDIVKLQNQFVEVYGSSDYENVVSSFRR